VDVQDRLGGSGQGSDLSHVSILILGPGPFWTRRTCDLIGTEFDTACLRLDSMDSASGMAPELPGLRLVIVDQLHAGDLLCNPDRYLGFAPYAPVGFGYRQSAVAQDLFRRFDERLGPIGYIPMNVPYEVWLSAIRLLLHGEYFLPSDLRPQIEGETGAAARSQDYTDRSMPTDVRLDALTEREREVLHLASAGDSNKLISRKLAISEHTVKLHMHHVYAKLGVSNRTAAASLLLAVGRSVQ
jgi:DNA-binding CsgD family transcriptional regulator